MRRLLLLPLLLTLLALSACGKSPEDHARQAALDTFAAMADLDSQAFCAHLHPSSQQYLIIGSQARHGKREVKSCEQAAQLYFVDRNGTPGGIAGIVKTQRSRIKDSRVVIEDNLAIVTWKGQQDGATITQEFQLERRGGKWLMFLSKPA